MAKHNETGKKGEDIAYTYLLEHNIQVLERNWRYKRAEVDVIGMDGKTLVFVEVKTRMDDILGRPENAVHTQKRTLMIKAAIAYMHLIKHGWAIRFDIVSVILRKEKPQIDHFKDAFFPGLAE
jgi:putative endonuclease